MNKVKIEKVVIHAELGCELHEGMRECIIYSIKEWCKVEYHHSGNVYIILPNKILSGVDELDKLETE